MPDTTPTATAPTFRTALPRTFGNGLSPRVRGNRLLRKQLPGFHRSIPACAGEPCRRRYRTPRPSVYPRVCGGTLPAEISNATAIGLSPRVRGNLQHLRGPGFRHRSIPACAGEPRRATRLMPFRQVYPRVCGGTVHRVEGMTSEEGLSPRVRGNRPEWISPM